MCWFHQSCFYETGIPPPLFFGSWCLIACSVTSFGVVFNFFFQFKLTFLIISVFNSFSYDILVFSSKQYKHSILGAFVCDIIC
jgi:hypothetical protein